MSVSTRRNPRRRSEARIVDGFNRLALESGPRVRVASAEGRGGIIRFVLQRVSGGLYVEREELSRKGARTSVAMKFVDREGFGLWFDDDPSRHDSPFFHQQLRKDADELWACDD